MTKKQKRREKELRSLDESLKQLAALKAPGVSLPGRKVDGQVEEEDDDDIFEDAGNDYVPKGELAKEEENTPSQNTATILISPSSQWAPERGLSRIQCVLG